MSQNCDKFDSWIAIFLANQVGELLSEAIQVWYQSLPEADTGGDRQNDNLDPCDPGCPTSLDDLLRRFASGT